MVYSDIIFFLSEHNNNTSLASGRTRTSFAATESSGAEGDFVNSVDSVFDVHEVSTPLMEPSAMNGVDFNGANVSL